MMNSTTGDDVDFPPNPFRSGGVQQQQQQQQHHHDPFAPQAAGAPMFAQPPPQQQQQQYAQQQYSQQQHQQQPQFIPQQQHQQQHQQQQFTSSQVSYANPTPIPSGQMNTNAAVNNNMANGAPSAMSRYEACLSCFKMETYLAYFDVDTDDISTRLKASVLLFYQPDKFRSEVIGAARSENLKGPDLYGPLWITMTLVFFLAVTSNLSAYFRADNMAEFEYDISHLAHAMTMCFGFAFGVPALWWLVTQCMGMQALMMVDWICLYGYSMVPFVPATIFSLIPFHPWIWLCLFVATVMSGLLVLRNVAAPLLGADTQNNKAGPILMAILCSHFIFWLILKLYFYE